MSRGFNRKSKKRLIILLIIVGILGIDRVMGIIGGLGSIVIGGLSVLFSVFGSLLILIALVYLITRSKNNNNRYTETKQREQTNMNPYSSNYSKEKAEQHQAYNQAKRDINTNINTNINKNTNINVNKTEPVKEAPKHKTTGDPEIDKMIVDKDLAIEEMKRLDIAIEDEALSAQIVHLEQVTEKIVAYIVKHPKKKGQVNKFFNYYLPTTLKLLNAYDRMDETGISGTNIDGTKEKVEDMMETALAAFDKQLDALYADEALDVSTDITVMENMLKSEGLTDDEITLHF